jgi:hypothetical protein
MVLRTLNWLLRKNIGFMNYPEVALNDVGNDHRAD